MKKELTNEEIAKVFAMYVGQKVKTYDRVLTLCHSSREVTDGISLSFCVDNRTQIKCKLLNIPLPKISDKDAIEVAKFVYTDAVGVMELIQIGNDYVSYNLCGGKLSTYSAQRLNQFSCVEDIQIFQYLISKGYAVPLFFAPGHWANGKTAIELGIAIDATTIKAEI